MALGGAVASRRVVEISVVGKGVDQEGRKLNDVLKSLERQADRTGKQFESTDKKIAGLGGGLRDLDARLGKIGAGFRNLGALAGVSVGVAAIGSAFRSAVGAASEFQSALSNLSAITGATGRDLEYLKNQALDISKVSRTSSRDILEGFKLVASAKPELLKNGEALAEVTRQTVILSEAAKIDLAAAAAAVTSGLNQFGESADQAARFVNALAAASQLGNIEVDKLNVVVSKAGTAAKTAGVGFEELVAIAGTIGSKFPEIASLGTGLRNVFLRLEASTDDGLRPSVVGLDQALDNLNAAGLGVEETMKKFGVENFNVVKSLLEARKAADQLEKSITDTNTAIEQQIVNNDNLEGDWDKLGNAFNNLSTRIVEDAGAIRGAVQLATQALNALADSFRDTTPSEAVTDAGGVFGALNRIVELEDKISEITQRAYNLGIDPTKNLAVSESLAPFIRELGLLKDGLAGIIVKAEETATAIETAAEVAARANNSIDTLIPKKRPSNLDTDVKLTIYKDPRDQLKNIEALNAALLVSERRFKIVSEAQSLMAANTNLSADSAERLAAQIVVAQEKLDRLKRETGEFDAAVDQFNKKQEDLRKLFAGQFTEVQDLQKLAEAAKLGSDAYDATRIHLEALNIARENGIDLQSQEVAAIEAYLHQIEDLNKELEKLNKKNEEAFKGFAEAMKADLPDIGDNIQTSLASGLTDTILAFNNAEDAFKSFATTFLRQIAQMIIQQIIFNALSAASGGGFGGAIAGAFANGAAFQGGNVIPFASGGVVDRPTVFPMARGMGLMGEAGPEAVVPLRRDSQGRLGVSSTAPTINIINNAGADVRVTRSDDEIIEIAVERATKANEAIYTRSMRDGYGPYSRGLEQGYRAKRRLG